MTKQAAVLRDLSDARLCPIPGCTNPSKGGRRARGLGAYCEAHGKLEAAQRGQRGGTASGAERVRKARADAATASIAAAAPGVHELRALSLAKLGQDLDFAIADEASAAARREQAVANWRRGLRALLAAEEERRRG